MFRKFTNPFLLVCWMVLSACAPALTPVPATATPTLTLEPTRTPTPTPTATITPTPTPSLPPEISANLQGQDYQVVDSDGDGQNDKIVAANGENLYVLNPDKDWQRIITFTLENGDKMEMFQFETAEEAYDYMVKDGMTWKATWGTKDLENTQEKIDFWRNKFFKIPEIDKKFMSGVFLNNNDNSSKTHIMVYSAGDGTVVVFLTDEGNLQAIYVDKSVSFVYSGLH